MEESQIPLLSTEEVILRMKANAQNSSYHENYVAMYSSIFGGITTDPAMMLVPLDDHMVHRGHAVFDTALVIKGHMYELDQHLDRLLRSASTAKITHTYTKETLKRILIETVGTSNCKNALVRYWLSAGPGSFDLSPKQCIGASFYAVVIQSELESWEPVRVVTSSIPMKAPLFAKMKTVNYIENVLSLIEAEEKGASVGIWIDDEGNVAEGPYLNVAFVNEDRELIMPPFDKILSGCTAMRILEIAKKLVDQPIEGSVRLKGVKVGPISVEQGKQAVEMMLLASGLPIVPVAQWDETKIGNGAPGPFTLALQNLIMEDMLNGPLVHHDPVPYRM